MRYSKEFNEDEIMNKMDDIAKRIFYDEERAKKFASDGVGTGISLRICPLCGKQSNGLYLVEENPISPYGVCYECKESYLKGKVLIMNPLTGTNVVINEEQLKKISNTPIPSSRVLRSLDENSIKQIRKALNLPKDAFGVLD